MKIKSTWGLGCELSTAVSADKSYRPAEMQDHLVGMSVATTQTEKQNGYFVVSPGRAGGPVRYAGSTSSAAETYRALNGQLNDRKR